MNYLKIIGIGLCAILLTGCKDDVASAGAGALAEDEEVRVCTGVLDGMVSGTDTVADFKITQTPDSFLLGEVHTDMWATIKADLLTQFAGPEGFVFPEQSEIDSIILMMTYTSWFAEGESPLRVSVYELDKRTFIYEDEYTSDLDVSEFWSGDKEKTNVVEQDQIVVAAHPKDSAYSSSASRYYPIIRFKMKESFVDKMRKIDTFPSKEKFNEFFKGLYITTTWGAATALYVDNIMMVMYYHYDYEGSTEPQKDVKVLYANSEVRQVNRYSFPNKQLVVDSLKKEDSVNYIISPGYVFTTMNVPLKRYVDTLLSKMITSQGDTLQPYINKALMRVDVLNVGKTSTTSDRWADPASNILLIRKDSLNSFFANHNLPSSDYCLLGVLSATLNSDYTYSYYYDFDVSTLLYNELHNKMQHRQVEDVEMVMVPVHVTYATTSSSTTVVSQVRLNQTITFTAMHSAQYRDNPLDIEVVLSGFTIKGIH